MANDFLSSLFGNQNIPSPMLTEDELARKKAKEDQEAEDAWANAPAEEPEEIPVPKKAQQLATPEEIAQMAQYRRSDAEEAQAQNRQPASESPETKEISNADQIENELTDLSQKIPQQQQSPISRYQDLINAYQSLKPAQEQYQQQLGNIAMLQGANQMAQGFARGYGADIGAGEAGIKALQQQAAQPIEAIGQQIQMGKSQLGLETDMQMSDPNSDISDYYRQYAYSLLKKLNPDKDFSGKLDNMSALQLQKLPGMKGLETRPSQQSQYISKITGNPLDYIPGVGYRDAITQKSVAAGEAVRGVAYADAFGNRVYVSPTGNVEVLSSKRGSTSDAQAEAFQPDKEQRTALDKEKTRIDDLTKNINEKISASNRILSALDSDSKQAMAVIKTQMPRLAGEVGNLNQAEQEVWQGSQSWLDKAQQFLERGVSSELTESNKKELRGILGIFLKEAVNSRSTIMDASANSLNKIYNIPPQFTKEAYGVLKPLTTRQAEVMEGNVNQPKTKTPHGGKYKSGQVVIVRGKEYTVGPDGNTLIENK